MMPLRHPVNGTLELTLRCNLRCKMCMFRHCDSDNARLAAEELTASQWADMARQLYDAGTLNLLITGGEPLLRKDFCEIYRSIYRLGFIVTLYTNATLVTEEVLDTLRQYPPHRIGITIYGASNETYAELCGCSDGFDRALAGASALATLPSALEFRTTVVQENYKDLAAIEALVKEKFNLPVTHSNTVFQSVRGGGMPVAECRLTPEQTVELTVGRVAERIRQVLPERLKGTAQLYVEDAHTQNDPERYSLLGCSAGMNSFTLTWNGKLLGCQMLDCFQTDAVALGFYKAWQEWPGTVKLPRVNVECASCSDMETCAICPAVRLAECGDLSGRPDYICRQTKLLAKKRKENLL